MAYSTVLADRIREYLAEIPNITVEEKTMFGGLAFLVNDKMCINIGEDVLMCRFDPERTEEIAEREGFLPVVMRGKELKGYLKRKKISFFGWNFVSNLTAEQKVLKKENKYFKFLNSKTLNLHHTNSGIFLL